MSAPTGQPVAQGDVLWSPPPDARERFVIGRYLAWLERERGLSFASYDELWRWSVSDLEGFWSSVWEFFEVRSHDRRRVRVRACDRRHANPSPPRMRHTPRQGAS